MDIKLRKRRLQLQTLEANLATQTSVFQNIYKEELGFLLYIAKLLFVSPFNINSGPNLNSRHAYAACGYLCCLVYTVIVIWDRASIIRWNYDQSIQFMSEMNFVCVQPLIPLTWWLSMRTVPELLEHWREFTDLFLHVTGTPLILDLHAKAIVLGVVTAGISLLASAMDVSTMILFRVWYSPLYMYCLVLTLLQYVLWTMSCQATVAASHKLVQHLRRAAGDLNPFRENENVFYIQDTHWKLERVIHGHRLLWIRLSDLVQLTGTTFSPLCAASLVQLFVKLIVSSYMALAQALLEGRVPDNLAAFILVSATVLFKIFTIVIAASRATTQVGEAVKEEVYSILNSRDHSYATKLEIKLFLQAIIMNPPMPTLGGYVDISKELPIAMISILVTYLLILIQFRMVIQDH